MRCQIVATLWLLSNSVQAALLHNWAAAGTPSWIPTETGTAKITDGTTGFSPKPTRAPGFVSEQDQVIELFRRQQGLTDTTPWVNDQTCGWVASTSSRAIACGSEFTCATNSDNLVACVSGTFSPFFRVCMDYSAVQQGQCENVGPGTGCCDDRASPACATWIWTGQPAKSQYGCAARSTIYSVLDVPQFILDSLTRTTSSSTKPTTIVSTQSTGTGTGTAAPSLPTPTIVAPSGNNNTGGNVTVGSQTATTTNLAPIIGGAVGGLAGLILLVLLLFCCMRKRRNKNSSTVNKSKTRNNTTVNYHNSQENQYNTNNSTIHEAKGSLGNDAMYERNFREVNNSGSGGGGVSAIFCCAGGRSGKKEKKEKTASIHSLHSGNDHEHHHHYHFDPHNNTGGAMSNATTVRNSREAPGGQTFRPVGQGMLDRSFSFEPQQPQPIYHSNGPASHSPYTMANAPIGQILSMPASFSHSPLGIMANHPVPRHELESASVVAAQTPPGQACCQHLQPQQHPHQHPLQHQPGLYPPPNENYYTSQNTHPAHLCNHHHHHPQHASHVSPPPAPATLPPGYPPQQHIPHPVVAMHTGVSALTSNVTGNGSSGGTSPQRLVSPSPMSSAASTIPSLHQHQQSIGGGDGVFHPLQPPPSARTSAANFLRFEDGAQAQRPGQDQEQQQHCSCCAANGHHGIAH